METTEGEVVDAKGAHRRFTPDNISDFEVETVQLGDKEPLCVRPIDSPSILLVLDGKWTQHHATQDVSNTSSNRSFLLLLHRCWMGMGRWARRRKGQVEERHDVLCYSQHTARVRRKWCDNSSCDNSACQP